MVIFKDSRAGVSKGCGLVTMTTKEAAEAAMTAIDGKMQMQVSAAHHTVVVCASGRPGN